MSGGLLAIKREFFFEMGEYDTAMQIWGCENVEISLRVSLTCSMPLFYCRFSTNKFQTC